MADKVEKEVKKVATEVKKAGKEVKSAVKTGGFKYTDLILPSIAGGFVGGIPSGLCCCLFQFFGGAIGAGVRRYMKGSKLETMEGVATGALSGVVGGLVSGGIASITRVLGIATGAMQGGSLQAVGINAGVGLFGIAATVLLAIFFGVILGAVAGLLVAELWK